MSWTSVLVNLMTAILIGTLYVAWQLADHIRTWRRRQRMEVLRQEIQQMVESTAVQIAREWKR